MKGYTTGIACGILAVLLLSNGHALLALTAASVLPIIVLAFWMGAIGIRWGHDHSERL
jgi:hypothetical protein